jgi:hypothetical protein
VDQESGVNVYQTPPAGQTPKEEEEEEVNILVFYSYIHFAISDV